MNLASYQVWTNIGNISSLIDVEYILALDVLNRYDRYRDDCMFGISPAFKHFPGYCNTESNVGLSG